MKIISYPGEIQEYQKLKLAKELGVTEASVKKRIKILEKKKIILGYRAIT